MSMKICETCKFWNEGYAENAPFTADEGFGECRKYAPRGPWNFGGIVRVVDDRSAIKSETFIMSGFASTSKQDWCGEWAADDEQP